MKLVVNKIKQETKDAVSISFKNNRLFNKIKYKPGQFLTVCVQIDGQKHKRAYSFSSSPHTEKELRITVKRVDLGLVSNFLCDTVKEGDKIEIEKPAGGFIVNPDAKESKQYVLFAGGSGITPILSIAKSVLAKEADSKVLIIYANQNRSSIIFHEELNELISQYSVALKVEHILAVDGEGMKHNYHPGLVTHDLVKTIFEKNNLDFENHQYMICGPFGYMDTVKEILSEENIGRGQIKVEVFKPPKVKVVGKDLLSQVTIALNGESFVMSARGDKTLLEEAMGNNIAIPYSCRSGMCSTCKAKCTSGDIKMIEGHILPEDEVNQGMVLTCVSYPVSEKVELEFLN